MEIEDDCPGNDRHSGFSGRVSDAARFQILHHPRRSVQAESASSAQEDRVDALHHMTGKARSQITRSRRGAPNIHSADRAPFAEDNRAPCQPFEVTRVTDADAWNRNDSLRESFRASRQMCLRVVLT